MNVLRTFVALVPCASTRERLADEARRLAAMDRAVRAVRVENLHLTLAFIGATPEDDRPAVESALRDVARESSGMDVVVEGLGAFPSPSRPRVGWAGLRADEGRAAVVALADRCSVALGAIGHPVDRPESFHPHVTIARIDGRPRDESIEMCLTRGTLQDTYFPEVLSDLLFMVSENDGRGTRYRPLATIPLGARPRR